jgi:hypothetical protein
MGPHQGQAELLNLLEELLESFVFGAPTAWVPGPYLREQILGDVDRVGPVSGAMEGHVLAGVQRATVVTAADGPATTVG